MMGYGGWMGLGGIGMLLSLLVWLGLVVAVVWSAASMFGRRPGDTRTEALDILKQRYAAGEITAAEFETARRALA
jgi:putative membrane protein